MYHTFPTPPPKTPRRESDAAPDGDSEAIGSDFQEESPLPVRQLLLLAVLSLGEQTALNSISPYLPSMIDSFPEMSADETGLYVGILASAFALAQLSTNFFWGYLSDRIGRKPTLLLGTFLLMCCFALFGFCKAYWQAVMVHIGMGMLNGNAAIVPTVLGEVTDRSNQSTAFTWLPIIYSLGGITGPALGGLLVGTITDSYPYLAPNLIAATLLALSVCLVALWFEETLESVPESEWGFLALRQRFQMLREKKVTRRLWPWNSAGLREESREGRETQTLLTEPPPPSPSPSSGNGIHSNGSGLSDGTHDTQGSVGGGEDAVEEFEEPSWKELLNHTTLVLLITYLVFQLSNISFNSLYPIFAAARPPTGRDLHPREIGSCLSIAGLVTILFQASLFQPLKSRFGNLGTYQFALIGLAVSMALMPWVGHVDSPPLFGLGTGKIWLYIELILILVFKSICAIGGLSSVMLLITNSAPSHANLGTLNGIAQTLSAAGRSFGPIVSGGLFTISSRVEPKGEALAWGLFGGIALTGWLGTLAIRRDRLESDDWHGQHHSGAREEA